MEKKTLKRVTLTLDAGDYASIDRLANANDVSSSWLIRRAIREFLERQGEDGRLSPTALRSAPE